MKKRLRFLFIAVVFLVFGWTIFINCAAYTTSYDPDYWNKRYQKSQWAAGWEASQLMGDAELYAYAGWRQIKGDDPTKINPEIPPFGRYLLGFSIALFKNQNVQALLFGFALLLVIFLLSKEAVKDKTWALLPVTLFSLDKLFREDLATSMLDLPFTLFICLSFYSLIKGRKNPWWYLGTMIFLAFVSTTKMYLVGFGLTFLVFLYLLFLLMVFRFKDLYWFLAFVPVFLLIYFASYSFYFLAGHNLADFKYLHFWVRHFARVQMPGYPKFEIWRMLLLGKWQIWWEGVIRASPWSPLWPLSFLAIFPTSWQIFKTRQRGNLPLVVLFLWPLALLAMYSYGLPYPRYLMPVLPPLYILLCYNLKLAFEKWRR